MRHSARASIQSRLLRCAIRVPCKGLLRAEVPLAIQRWLLARPLFAVPRGVRLTRSTARPFQGEWLHPLHSLPNTAILYLHGGAYCVGTCATYRALAGQIAQAARVPTLLLDYRQAPEHPFPAALDDAIAAYRALLAQGIAPQRLVVAGDSAGGGLALALALALRDAGDALPGALVTLSAWTDLACTGASFHACAATDPVLSPSYVRHVARLYLGGTDPRAPLASPLYADLRGLPPLLMLVDHHEMLRDDSVRFADRARQAGGAVTLEVARDLWHVWPLWAALVPESRDAIQRIGAFIRQQVVE